MRFIRVSFGLGLAVAGLPVAAQPNLAGAATPARPIVQPNFVSPATVAPQPIGPLPSGNYTLTLKYEPHSGFPLGNTTVLAVALTHSFNALTLQAVGHPFVGTVDAAGILSLSMGDVRLAGSATGNSAQGLLSHDPAPPPGHLHAPNGTFTLAPANAP